MKVGKSYAGPPGAKHSVIDPASDCQHPEDNASTTQAEHTDVVFHFQLMYKKEHGGHTKC